MGSRLKTRTFTFTFILHIVLYNLINNYYLQFSTSLIHFSIVLSPLLNCSLFISLVSFVYTTVTVVIFILTLTLASWGHQIQ